MMDMFIMDIVTATCDWYDRWTDCLILIDINSDSHMLDSTGLDFSNLKAKS